MKEITYIGFYCGEKNANRITPDFNYAGTMKMNFIIQSLKKIGYKVSVVSLAYDNKGGYHKEEKIVIDEKETHIFLPYFSIAYKNKPHFYVQSLNKSLCKYANENFTKDSIVLSYHSLAYDKHLSKLKNKIGFKWISQIEEIYCLSSPEEYKNESLEDEVSVFFQADGYLFVNDLLPEIYANNKPYAVSYGNYKVYDGKTEESLYRINIVYTGIINNDRGAFLLLEAFKYLPDNYYLNLLGFGEKETVERFKERIDELNQSFNKKRISFDGTRSGEEYSKYLVNNQIGISLMNQDCDVSGNAFPSKIMSYLGHSLYVVASNVESIRKSKVADMLYLCDNNEESIVKAILSVPVNKKNDNAVRLKKLEADFCEDLKKVIEYNA